MVGNLGAPVDLARQFDLEGDVCEEPRRISSDPLTDGLPVAPDREQLLQ